MNDKKCVVVIPAYNEENSIEFVLKNIPKDIVSDVIVVNNNSTDNTPHIAKTNGAIVIDEIRRGYGQACLTGIERAFELSPDIIAFLDADFSDNPEDLRALINELNKGCDLVIGSRVLGGAENGALLPQAIFGNWLATRLMRWFFGGYPFTDLGPFRVIRADALKHLKMNDRDFGWTVEMQAKALISKMSCSEISVHYKKRIGISKITGTLKGTFLAGYKILGTIGYLYLKNIFNPIPIFKSKIT
ncbi:MAG: glycosyltransferase family 2 protein [Bacteriovoracaceae bacterium]|nr:glycosyltransferase family 2 protein [Bacteriovoracaceae bacterium]